MEKEFLLKENWLTRDPSESAFVLTWLFTLFVIACSFFFFENTWHAQDWMAASGEAVFQKHQFWRAWTTLFVHGDMGHLLGNLFLLVPLAYFLSGYYGTFFFPLLGVFVGGLTNLVVLKTMPPETTLVGISGVVYWMGSAWLSLYLLINHRESLRRRWGKILFISAVLFLPETYKGEISYLSHFVGFIFGILSASIFYVARRQKFKAAEVFEQIPDDEKDFVLETKSVNPFGQSDHVTQFAKCNSHGSL